jgi:hypothetical protein
MRIPGPAVDASSLREGYLSSQTSSMRQPLKMRVDHDPIRPGETDDEATIGSPIAAATSPTSGFVDDSPLEGGGFEPSVPLWRMAPGPASAELREVPAGQLRFAPDSALEGSGFELPVPREIALRSRSGLALHLGSLALRRRGPDWDGRPTGEAWVPHRRLGLGVQRIAGRADEKRRYI